MILPLALAAACAPPAGAQPDDEESRGRPAAHPRPAVLWRDSAPAARWERVFGELRFQRPVDAAPAPLDPAAPEAAPVWFVVEQRGLILAIRRTGDSYEAEPFLDIRERVTRAGNEEGLLGLAWSPHFAERGHAHEGAFYVNYSVRPGPLSRLSRFFVAPGSQSAAADSEEILLEVEQPWRNHNGGGLLFGPDGMLYYSLGDGGAADDPRGHGQNPGTLLGSILRLDVGPRPAAAGPGALPYAIPPDNPLLGRSGARGEIWAWGLRNVWRFAFDPATGDCWGADVGQNDWEFVFVLQAGGNHGWNLLEGFRHFRLPDDAALPAGLVAPVFEYPHPQVASDEDKVRGNEGLSITGGFVYRGAALPELSGFYIFADYVTRHVWAIRRVPAEATARDSADLPRWRPAAGEAFAIEHLSLPDAPGPPAAFAQDRDGEHLLIDHHGWLWQLVPASGEN